jgi:phosphoserine phosphatase RsbU/P
MVDGDYYDFLDMGTAEVGIVLADIAGKGIPAALLMASLQGICTGSAAMNRKTRPNC